MLSNKLRKQIQQLKLKKFRKQYKLFVAEGEKVVLDLLLAKFIPEFLLASKEFETIEPLKITTQQMRSITHFSTPSPIMGVFQIPKHTIDSVPNFQLVLDRIKDPGNLGTIIRTCDWYGLSLSNWIESMIYLWFLLILYARAILFSFSGISFILTFTSK